jgi:hypothetical protein
MVSRRELLFAGGAASAAAVLIGSLRRSSAWKGGRPEELDRWARAVVGINERVSRGDLDVVGWQREIARAHAAVELAALVRYLDVERLTREFRYGSNLAETADPVLPPEIAGAGPRRWFVRVFGLRRGGAIIPHVHNAMVSAHLVIGGAFHARTHDRVRGDRSSTPSAAGRHGRASKTNRAASESDARAGASGEIAAPEPATDRSAPPQPWKRPSERAAPPRIQVGALPTPVPLLPGTNTARAWRA